MVASTAVVSGLLLVAVSIARLGGSYQYGGPDGNAPLLGPIADPGTRAGSVLAVVLVAVPVALLLDQCVRLGSAAQRRRYQALAVAGATGRDLRRWGAVESGVPALAGALLGVPVWMLLRLLLGDALANSNRGTLVPTATGPGLWALAVIAVVAAYGVLVGRRAAVRATAATRRESGPPRPWGPVLLIAAFVALAAAFGVGLGSSGGSDVWILAAAVLAVLGFTTSTAWLAYVVSGLVTRRTGSAAMLLATRRIRADHGAAGRAAAAVGAVGLTLGVLGVFLADLAVEGDNYDVAYYVVPSLLVGILALLALGVITLSLSLHSIETTLERRREMSALVATGRSGGHLGGGQPRGVPAGDAAGHVDRRVRRRARERLRSGARLGAGARRSRGAGVRRRCGAARRTACLPRRPPLAAGGRGSRQPAHRVTPAGAVSADQPR